MLYLRIGRENTFVSRSPVTEAVIVPVSRFPAVPAGTVPEHVARWRA
jgi:hypothetical protein